MQTVPETTTPVQFDDALYALAAQARTRYAGEHARIDRGLVIALNHGVTLHADGSADVQSASDPELVYHVAHGTCDCPDFQRAPDGRCKHRWSVCLTRKATQQMTATQTPAAAQTYYATYTEPTGLVLQGTATWRPVEQAWLFVSDANEAYLTRRAHALVLGGNVQVLEAQREADGNLAAKVCRGYAA